MENRSQFTFYESFYHALRRIKKKADRADAYDAICAYALFGTEPDMDALSDSVAIAFALVKPNLEASRRKAVSGKKGGLRQQTTDDGDANEGSKPQANVKQSRSKREKENEIENKIENECYHSLYPSLQTESSRKIPTLEQVEEYATLRNATVNPQEFFDYYSQGNWCDAEGRPVRNWQQKFIAWEVRGKKQGGVQQGTVSTTDDAEAERLAYEEDFERMGRYLERMQAEQSATARCGSF